MYSKISKRILAGRKFQNLVEKFNQKLKNTTFKSISIEILYFVSLNQISVKKIF